MKIVYKQKQKNTKQTIIIFLFAIMPIMDSINGFFESVGIEFSIGLTYRLATLCILFTIQVRGILRKKIFIIYCMSMAMFLILMGIHILFGADLVTNIYMLLTWIMFPTYLILAVNAKEKGYFTNVSIQKVLEIYLWIVPLTILIPRLMGLGFTTYTSGHGYKAFYHATNGISFFLGVLIIYMAAKIASNMTVINLVQLVLIVACCFLVGTMVSIGSIAIAFVVYVYITLRDYPNRRIYVLIGIPILLIVGYLAVRHYADELMSAYLRKMYFYKSDIFGSFVDFITSGRTVLFREMWDGVKSENTIFVVIFGQGTGLRACEMDVLDLFLQYGVIGIITYFYLTKKILTYYRKWRTIFKILIIFSLVYAAIVGHVFSSTLSSTLLVIIMCTDEKYRMTTKKY